MNTLFADHPELIKVRVVSAFSQNEFRQLQRWRKGETNDTLPRSEDVGRIVRFRSELAFTDRRKTAILDLTQCLAAGGGLVGVRVRWQGRRGQHVLDGVGGRAHSLSLRHLRLQPRRSSLWQVRCSSAKSFSTMQQTFKFFACELTRLHGFHHSFLSTCFGLNFTHTHTHTQLFLGCAGSGGCCGARRTLRCWSLRASRTKSRACSVRCACTTQTSTNIPGSG